MPFPPKGNFLRALGRQDAMFQVTCSEVPDMRVRLREGSFWDNGTTFVEFPGGVSKPLTAPSVGAKVVIVGVTISGAISIIDGQPATTSPKTPECPKNVMPCALILLQSTSKAITQEMIFDCRPNFYTRYPVSHNDLKDRNVADAHDIASITGLEEELSARPNEEQLNLWLKTKADQIGTNSCVFIFNRAGSGVPTEDLQLVFERGDTLNAILKFPKESDRVLQYSNDNGTTWTELGGGSTPVDAYTKEEVNELLAAKEDVIDPKNTAFNKDFGTEEGTVAEGNHLHQGVYAPAEHEHQTVDTPVTKELYVDMNRVDEYEANGSITRPFKTISAAAEVAEDGDTINIMSGTYNEDVVLPNGVSMHGSSNKTIIAGDVTIGAIDDQEHCPVSLRDIQFGKKNSTKKVTINYTCEMYTCVFYSVMEFARSDKSVSMFNTNFRANSAEPALKSNARILNLMLGTVDNSGTGKSIELTAGMATLNTTTASSSNASETILAGGSSTINLMNSTVQNNKVAQGGKSLTINTSSANPSGMMCDVMVGGVECGAAKVLKAAVKMMVGTINGTNIEDI